MAASPATCHGGQLTPEDAGIAGRFDAGTRAPPTSSWANVEFAHPLRTWVQQSPAASKPSPRFLYEGGGARDPFTKLFFHHAGHDGMPQEHDLFSFDVLNQTWAQVFTSNSPLGSCLVEGSMAFDTVESGPSPYQLTIPSAPQMLMIDDATLDAKLKWQAPSEGNVVEYRMYGVPSRRSLRSRRFTANRHPFRSE